MLRLLGALAPPLILAAIVHALMTAQLEGALTFRLVRLLIMNTLVAICVGLTVANLLEPGAGAGLKPPTAVAGHTAQGHADPWLTFVENFPKACSAR